MSARIRTRLIQKKGKVAPPPQVSNGETRKRKPNPSKYAIEIVKINLGVLGFFEAPINSPEDCG